MHTAQISLQVFYIHVTARVAPSRFVKGCMEKSILKSQVGNDLRDNKEM